MTAPTILRPTTTVDRAEQLNRDCRCNTLDDGKLQAELARCADPAGLYRMLTEERPHLFADTPVFITRSCLRQQAEIIAAIERVVAIPAYQDHVLAYAPEAAWFQTKAAGVFLGYDFHLGDQGPRLIEINSNAGGALLNAMLPRVHKECCNLTDGSVLAASPLPERPEQVYADMFMEEWRLEREDAALTFVAIVDDQPKQQFLYPEFLLFQELFRGRGIASEILDPGELTFRDGALLRRNRRVDLIYNRLTDFGLEQETHRHLRESHGSGAVVLTPHPRAHAIHADKRNLAILTDDSALQALGVDSETRRLLQRGIAHTEIVRAENAGHYWNQRKHYFFKPAAGYGSKAAYRGDKLTRRVFGEILQGDYVVQELVIPSERSLLVSGEAVSLKVDLRNFVYRSQVQAIASRIYQGQTTNLRTPGGGFAPVIVLPDQDLSCG